MTRYFMRDTPLRYLEQEMMTPPHYKPRGHGLYRRDFHYRPCDVECQFCVSFAHRSHCPLDRCSYLSERMEAGVLGMSELMQDCFSTWTEPRLQGRLKKLFCLHLVSFFLSDAHRSRWQHWHERYHRIDNVLDVVEESCAEVLEIDIHTELEQVQQNIISIQEAVLALHKAQEQGAVSEMEYEIKIASYSQQMDELQERQRELKATSGRFAEVKYWMDTFKEHVHCGEKMDTDDVVMFRQFTDRIVVYDDRLEIRLRIGGTLEQKYK